MEGSEWIGGFEHESLSTPELKQEFASTMGKYKTDKDALVGGFNAMKMVGKPFRLPESLDKLPDDKTRGELTAQIGRLYGAVENEEALADINWTDGMAEGSKAAEPLVNAIKKFAVENKISKSLLQRLIKFNNEFSGSTELKQYKKAQEDAADLVAANTTHEELVKKLGSDDAVKSASGNVKKMFLKVYDNLKEKIGMTAEEFEAMADGLVNSGITKSAPLTLALMEIAKSYAESTTPAPGAPGAPEKKGTSIEKELPNSSKALGWT
jgi:hypothetical protein